ncbi:MAG: ADP-glyceromanno-heptose 6-epimerase [Candidatus Hatepunaea meridiana]|nr:ADP-glyceromanno-heptose 6-epimerase [Candidatus Hatepunaea meridiana]
MIIVTGGAGFIGSAIVWALNVRGMTDILVVDELESPEKWKNLTGLSFTDYFEKGDFLDAVLAGKFRKGTEAIFHMGACSSTTETDAVFLVKNNFEYTKHLAEFAVREAIRFIYASSAATYGDGSKGYSDQVEDPSVFMPLNMYATSKQMFDVWAHRNELLDKIAGLKYFNVFGPNEYHKGDMRSLVCKGYEEIKETGRLRLFKSYRSKYADGEQVRDFIYVKDAVEMTLFFLDNPALCGIFNVGSGTVSSWNALGTAIFDAMGLKKNIEYVEMPNALREKYQYHTMAETRKIRQAGYEKPVAPLADAVREYVQNYLQHGLYLRT